MRKLEKKIVDECKHAEVAEMRTLLNEQLDRLKKLKPDEVGETEHVIYARSRRHAFRADTAARLYKKEGWKELASIKRLVAKAGMEAVLSLSDDWMKLTLVIRKPRD